MVEPAHLIPAGSLELVPVDEVKHVSPPQLQIQPQGLLPLLVVEVQLRKGL